MSLTPGLAAGTALARLSDDDKLRIGSDVQRRLGMKTSRDEPLARFTTLRVGGRADLFAEARNLFELRGIARFARARDIPLSLIGRGSDLVISDTGIGGLVVLVRAQGLRIEDGRLVAESGLPMARAASVTREAGLTGLEFALAIPGTVGGAVWANAGAHGADVSGVLQEALIVTSAGDEATVGADDLAMAYRQTRLKLAAPGRPEIVLAATFQLRPDDPAAISARLEEIKRWRQANQPLGQKSAGSVFRNPEGDSAGRIIDGLGLKGLTEGGAMVSPRHANFIVNTGTARAVDVRRLGDRVREIVRAERGIQLAYEVEFVGDWSDLEPTGSPAETRA